MLKMTSWMLHWKHRSIKFMKDPVKVATSIIVFSASYCAVMDYCHELDFHEGTPASLEYIQRPTIHLGEKLENLHEMAASRRIKFHNLVVNQYYCDELNYLFHCAEQKKKELIEYYPERSEEYLEGIVAEEYTLFAQIMCRRALIRNGKVIKWFKCVTRTSILKSLFFLCN
jgi:hypothetical protein